MSKSIGLSALCVAVTLAAAVFAGVPRASATVVCVVGTANTSDCPNAATGPGGTLTLTSANAALTVSGGGTLTCSHTTFTGTGPAQTGTATVATPIALRSSGCIMSGLASTLTTAAACDPGGAAPINFNVTAASPTGAPFSTLTIPSGCTITARIPALGCTVQITGPQTIGNGTTGVGGQTWVNGTSLAPSRDHINGDTLTTTSNGVGAPACPSAGSHSATLIGTYTVTSPATRPGAEVRVVNRWHSVDATSGWDSESTTVGGAVRFVSKPSNTPINCTKGTLTGHTDTDKNGPAAGTWSGALAPLPLVFTGCTLGADTITFQCVGGMNWNAVTYNGPLPKLADAPGQSTAGQFTGFNCDMYLDHDQGMIKTKTNCGTFDGTVQGVYTNSNINSATLSMDTAGQALTWTTLTCALGADTSINIGAPGVNPADLNPLIFTVKPPANPILWYGTNP